MNRLLSALGSLKLTLPGMALLVVGVLASYRAALTPAWWVAAPLALLAVNLAAAIATNVRFRRQPGLLVFHLCLLAVLLLAAAGRLAYFSGRAQVLVGEAFDAAAVQVQSRGPWHPGERLDGVSFVQGDFSVAYAPGLTRGETRSEVSLPDRANATAVVGDTRPLKAAGFRFYTTSNKGYAALLTWLGEDGGRSRGAIHFPSYPLKDWNQVNRWRTSAGTELRVELVLARRAPDTRDWVLDSRRARGAGSLRVHRGERSRALQPGEWLELPGGRLRFDELRMWMGYHIAFDPMLSWLLAAGALGVAGLAWHFWRKLWSRPLAAPEPESTRHSGRDAPLVHT